MIDIKSSAEERLTFAMDLKSASERDVDVKFRLTHENVEYGFTGAIKGGEIVVNLPALDTVIPGLKDKDVLNAKLEAVANGDMYLSAWSDTIQIERPVQLKAAVKESATIEEETPVLQVSSVKKTIIKESKPRDTKAPIQIDESDILDKINNITDSLGK